MQAMLHCSICGVVCFSYSPVGANKERVELKSNGVDNVKNSSTIFPEAVGKDRKDTMTTLRFNTIWDLSLVSRGERSEGESRTRTAPVSERFLTIWDSAPLPRAKAAASKRARRRMPRFYI
ncbi:hypothetical protein Q427_22110 [Halomonas sp. BC04]|nr:hypothetical protein Q427_22110 [Halomonas sp. BC04]